MVTILTFEFEKIRYRSGFLIVLDLLATFEHAVYCFEVERYANLTNLDVGVQNQFSNLISVLN